MYPQLAYPAAVLHLIVITRCFKVPVVRPVSLVGPVGWVATVVPVRPVATPGPMNLRIHDYFVTRISNKKITLVGEGLGA